MTKEKSGTFPIAVRFSDIDEMGHVNNAVYLVYFEEARIRFFNAFLGDQHDWFSQGIIVARNEVDYLKPIRLGDAISATVWCSSPGNKSFSLHYELRGGEDNALFAKGLSIIVCFDYKQKTPYPVPEIWKRKFVME